MSSRRASLRPEADDEEPMRDPNRKVRRRKNMNPLEIDPSRVPEGMTWEYKRETVLGQSDKAYDLMLKENAWEPVDEEVAKAAGVMASYGGLRLMQRPEYLTQEAREEEIDAANRAVRGKEMDARRNMTGQELGEERVGTIKKSYAPIPD